MCATVPLHSDFFCCMTTVRQLSSPAMDKLQRQLNMTNNNTNTATL